jgi:transcriptional regulator with XRE-family HTH domain
MSRNIGFGQRVRQAREKLGASREDAARLSGLALARYKMIEYGQLDHSDLLDEELKLLSSALQVTIDWLVRGDKCTGFLLPEGSVAQRTDPRLPIQGYLNFRPDVCPNCWEPAQGCRCGTCGHPLE